MGIEKLRKTTVVEKTEGGVTAGQIIKGSSPDEVIDTINLLVDAVNRLEKLNEEWFKKGIPPVPNPGDTRGE